jgi:hypothetical protein
VEIQRDDDIVPSGDYNDKLEETIEHILEFNRNCKRRKGKKKDSENEGSDDEP